jgi:hypothetical protein
MVVVHVHGPRMFPNPGEVHLANTCEAMISAFFSESSWTGLDWTGLDWTGNQPLPLTTSHKPTRILVVGPGLPPSRERFSFSPQYVGM